MVRYQGRWTSQIIGNKRGKKENNGKQGKQGNIKEHRYEKRGNEWQKK